MGTFADWKPQDAAQRNDRGAFDDVLDWFVPNETAGSISADFSQQQAQQQAYQQEQANPTFGNTFTGNVGGFAGSALSGMTELFGFDAPTSVQRWRDEHPVMDIASQLAGFAVPYAGAFKLSQAPKAAKMLDNAVEGSVKAFGSTSARSPVSAGALREFYRYTPLELSRLGTGYAIGADMGPMFADVALSQSLAVGLGGVGGFLRAGGQAMAQAPRMAGEGADLGLLPTFDFRLARTANTPESQVRIVGENVDIEQFRHSKRQEALKWVPEAPKGSSPRYVYNLQNATPETQGFVESLFKPNASNIGEDALKEQPFDIRQLHTDGKKWSVGEGVGEDVAKKAGFEDLDDLAATAVGPRLAAVQGRRSAGMMGGQIKKLMDQGALQRVDEDTLMGVEDGGLRVVMKRVDRGPEPPKVAGKRRNAFQFGPAQIREGDRWLVAKTDQPNRFAPNADKVTRANVEHWAKYRDAFRQTATLNPFNQEMNRIMAVLAPEDWQLARNTRKTSWVSQTAPKIAERIKATGGLADSRQIQQMTDNLYDVIAPKAAKMMKNPVYGRFYSLLEGGMKYADSTLMRLMRGSVNAEGSLFKAAAGKNVNVQGLDGFRPVREIWEELDDMERQLVIRAAHTQTPADDLAKLSADGSISPRAAQAVTELQQVNEHMLQKYVLPALEEAGRAGEFNWLKGYIMPRVFKGDWMVRVTDEAGKPQWLASGTTPAEAQKMANYIVEEAGTEGKRWKALEPESKVYKEATDADTLDSVYAMVHEQMGQSADAQATVQKAMRKLLSEQDSSPMPGRGLPSSQRKRTGLAGAPDIEHYSLDDAIAATENHYRQMLRLSALTSWQHRFGETARRWGQGDELGYTDLMRKASQWMGAEGKYTQVLNKMLQPVFGSTLGAKAASRIAQGVNSTLYAWNLGIMNPTFALLNLLTPLQTVAPWIAFMQRTPMAEAEGMMQQVLRFDSQGRVRGSASIADPLKIIMQAIKLGQKPNDEIKGFFTQAVSDGTLSPQLYDMAIGGTSEFAGSLKDAYAKNAWEGIKKTSTLLATRSEEFSRLVAFNSAYLLGKNFFKLEGDALYRFARKGTEQTMYGYSVMDRSRILTGPIGSTFGLFKNWQFHFINQMAQYAGVGMRDGVWSPMLWQGAAATAVGGLGATPLVMVANGLAKANTEHDTSFEWLRDNFGDSRAGDAIYYGLPGLIGVSLQASSMIPGTDVTQDIESMTNVVAWQRASAAWKATGAAFDQWEGTGRNPLRDPNIRDSLMQAFAPRAMFRMLSTTEGDYIRSMTTGRPTVRDLPPVTKVLHAAGFNMTEIENHYIMGETLFKRRERQRDAIQDLGNAMANAQLEQNWDLTNEIARRAIVTGVPIDSVMKSARTRYSREKYGEHLTQYGDAQAQMLLD